MAMVERFASVGDQIADACARAGRDPDAVRLIAVSKRHSVAAIEAAYQLGHREFGENYAQELLDKSGQLTHLSDLRFRFIGHLQRNKARRLVEAGCTVDTVDSPRLADALAQAVPAGSAPLEVLVQVNVAGEAQKSGVAPAELPALVAHIRAQTTLDLRGLMTVPPAVQDPESSRAHFAALAELAAAHGLPELSMGMSHDLSVAVEEGATMVRVGTALFGKRPES